MFLRITPRDNQRPSLAALLPNLLTTLAVCSGLASLHFSLKGELERAVAAIVVAAIFDALDGRAARLLRVSSKFGAVLDSLSDFLAFGVAPAVVLYQWKLKGAEVPGSAAAMTYALCAALRLARFTAADMPGAREPAAKADRPSHFFTGMPSPAGAGVALLLPMLAFSDTLGFDSPTWLVIAMTFVVGVAMISRVPMFSLKGLHVKRHYVAPFLVLVGLIVVAAVRDVWLTLAAMSTIYLLLIPVAWISVRTRDRRAGASPQAAESTPPPAEHS